MSLSTVLNGLSQMLKQMKEFWRRGPLVERVALLQTKVEDLSERCSRLEGELVCKQAELKGAQDRIADLEVEQTTLIKELSRWRSLSEIEVRVLESFRTTPFPDHHSEIATALGEDKNRVLHAIQSLRHSGLVDAAKKYGSTKHYWKLTPQGSEYLVRKQTP